MFYQAWSWSKSVTHLPRLSADKTRRGRLKQFFWLLTTHIKILHSNILLLKLDLYQICILVCMEPIQVTCSISIWVVFNSLTGKQQCRPLQYATSVFAQIQCCLKTFICDPSKYFIVHLALLYQTRLKIPLIIYSYSFLWSTDRDTGFYRVIEIDNGT